jgi:hypothetical protein
MVMVKAGDKYIRVSPMKGKKRPEAHFPQDENGNPIPGPGRKPGIPNRISGEAKKFLALAFEGIGGLDRLITEADKNYWEFMKLYAKLIPIQVQGKVDLDVNINGEAARRHLESAVYSVIDAKRAARQSGAEDPAVYIDGERVRDITPQLGISRQARTDTAEIVEDRKSLAELAIPGGTRRGKDKNGSGMG